MHFGASSPSQCLRTNSCRASCGCWRTSNTAWAPVMDQRQIGVKETCLNGPKLCLITAFGFSTEITGFVQTAGSCAQKDNAALTGKTDLQNKQAHGTIAHNNHCTRAYLSAMTCMYSHRQRLGQNSHFNGYVAREWMQSAQRKNHVLGKSSVPTRHPGLRAQGTAGVLARTPRTTGFSTPHADLTHAQ